MSLKMRTVEYKEYIVDLPDGSEFHLTADALEAVQMLIKQAMEDEKQNPWKREVLDGLIVAHIFTKEHESNPVKALNDLICWSNDVALDPKVSSRAAELIRQGMYAAGA